MRLVVGTVLAAVLAAGALFAVGVPRLLATSDHQFQVSFTNADGLVAGSDVLEAGSKIGTISDIQPTEADKALVTVQISNDHWPLRTGFTVGIRPKSLLGEKYVDIHDGAPSAAAYTPSGPIAAADKDVPVELDQFINSLDPDTRSAARILLSDVGAGLAGRGDDLNSAIAASRASLDHLAVFGTTLNNRDADLDRIILGLDGVLGKITQADQLLQISQLITNGQQTLNAIETQKEAFSRTFTDANTALTELNLALGTAVPVLRQTIELAPQLLANLQTEASALAALGTEVNNPTVLPALIDGIKHGPTSTGGAVEMLPDGTKLPIFRICLITLPGSCDGNGGFRTPDGNGIPAANHSSGSDTASLAAMMGA